MIGPEEKAFVENDFFKSLGQAAFEISLHEAYHVGQVAALRKIHGKPPVA